MTSSVVPPPIVKRAEWGAEPTTLTKKYVVSDLPIHLIYVSLKSHIDHCKTKEECCEALRKAQAKFKPEIGDIPYSFIISEDGTIYEGRGWEYKPQKAIDSEPKDFDPRSYDIAYFGDWSEKDIALPDASFNSLIELLEYGIKRKYTIREFELSPFREEKFEPVFYPGKEYFEKNIKEIHVPGEITVKEAKNPEEKKEEEKFAAGNKVKWDFPF